MPPKHGKRGKQEKKEKEKEEQETEMQKMTEEGKATPDKEKSKSVSSYQFCIICLNYPFQNENSVV